MARPRAQKYKVVERNTRAQFFTIGKIFLVPIPNSRRQWNSTPGFRRYVVIHAEHGRSICLIIKTYENQATTKPDIIPKQNQHAIIYTGRACPTPLRGETALRRPIGAEVDPGETALPRLARLNYGDVFVVEHDEIVHGLGHILPEFMDQFVEDFEMVQRLREETLDNFRPPTNRRPHSRNPSSPSSIPERPPSPPPPPPPLSPSFPRPAPPTSPVVPEITTSTSDEDVEAEEQFGEYKSELEDTMELERDPPTQGSTNALEYLIQDHDGSKNFPVDHHETGSTPPYSPAQHFEDREDLESDVGSTFVQHSQQFDISDGCSAFDSPSDPEEVDNSDTNENHDTDVQSIDGVGQCDQVQETPSQDEDVPNQDMQSSGFLDPQLNHEHPFGNNSDSLTPPGQESMDEGTYEVESYHEEQKQDPPSSSASDGAEQAREEMSKGTSQPGCELPHFTSAVSEADCALNHQTGNEEDGGTTNPAPGLEQPSTPSNNTRQISDEKAYNANELGLGNWNISQPIGAAEEIHEEPENQDASSEASLGGIQFEPDSGPANLEDITDGPIHDEPDSSPLSPDLTTWQFPPAEMGHTKEIQIAREGEMGSEEPEKDGAQEKDSETPRNLPASGGHQTWNVRVIIDEDRVQIFQVLCPTGITPQVKCEAEPLERQDSLEDTTDKPIYSAQPSCLPDQPTLIVSRDSIIGVETHIEREATQEASKETKSQRPELEVVTNLPGSFPIEQDTEIHELPSTSHHNNSPTGARDVSPKMRTHGFKDLIDISGDDSTPESKDEHVDSRPSPSTSPGPASSQTSYESQVSEHDHGASQSEVPKTECQERSTVFPTATTEYASNVRHTTEHYNQSYHSFQGQQQQPSLDQYWSAQCSNPYQPYPTIHSGPPQSNFMPSSYYYSPADRIFTPQMPPPNRPFPVNMQPNYAYPGPHTQPYIQPQTTPVNFGFGSGPQFAPANHHSQHQPQQQQQQPYVFPSTARSGVSETQSNPTGRFETDLIFYDDQNTRTELLRALLDTGATLNFISEEKARIVGLNLLPHLGQDVELANGHRIRPRFNVSARWRQFRDSRTTWTDRFVVLSEMGGRDVIIGCEILENRLFLLQKNELNVLGLPKLSKRELQEQQRAQEAQQEKNKEKMMEEEKEMRRKERERRAVKKEKKQRKERQQSPGSAEEEVYHSSRER